MKGQRQNIKTWVMTIAVVAAIFAAVFSPAKALAMLEGFRAYEDAGRVVVEWRTGFEMGTVGFYLMRQVDEKGKYVRVNTELLPGLLVSRQGGTYRYVDQGASPGNTYTYQLIEVEARGKKRVYGPFTVEVDGEGVDFSEDKKAPRTEERMTSRFMKKARKMSDSKKARIKKRKLARKAAKASKGKRKGPMAKMAVTDSGLYFLGAPEIASLLNVPERRVSRLIGKNQLSLTNRGEPVAYVPAADRSGIYFYGEGIESIYAKENIYWLKKGKGLKMKIVNGKRPKPSKGDETFIETLHIEEDNWALTGIIDDPEADYWVWDYIVAGFAGFDSKRFSLHLHGVTSTGTAALTVRLQGATDTKADKDHQVVVSINGTEIGAASWDGMMEHELTLSFEQSLLKEGENSIEVSGVLYEGVPYSICYVDSFDLIYERRYRAVDNRLLCRGAGNEVVTVGGFTQPDIYLFEVTDPNKAKLVKAATVDQAGSEWRISFRAADPKASYLALTLDASSAPVSVTTDTPSRLRAEGNRAEYLVITSSELKEVAQSLADYRQAQGLEAMVVELEDIYDEFNDGLLSPKAIRDFLSYAYNNWRRAPGYVVLAGEGTYDYKNNQGYGDNLVPPLMVSTPYGLFASDNRFVDVEGDDGVPEMAIGRLPVMTSEELEAVIDKIVAYESGGGGEWTDKVLMLADNPDKAGNFPVDSDQVALILPEQYTAEKIYLSEHSIGEARQLVREGINDGALLINYIGHAGLDRLADEGMLRTSDMASLKNADRLPVVAAMACVLGQFAIPGYDSLGEKLVLHDIGGAIAVWASTGLSMNSQARILDKEFFRATFEGGESILGLAVLRALEAYSGLRGMPYILDIYNLIGDPALEIR